MTSSDLPEGITERDVNATADAIPALIALATAMKLPVLDQLLHELETQHSKYQAAGFIASNSVEYTRNVEQIRFNMKQTRALRDFAKAVQFNHMEELESRKRHAHASEQLERLNKALGIE
jgi:hypothetical protein